MLVSYITKLGPVDVTSDVTPQVEVSSGLEWYYVRSAWHFICLFFRITFHQMYSLLKVSRGESSTTLGPVDLSSHVPPNRAT